MTPPCNKNLHRKPGLTAKGDQRQYVQHSYTDRSNDIVETITTSDENTLRLYREDAVGGPFPLKLQIVLKVIEKLGQQHIISWLPHGRSFMIHRPREFEMEVMGKFFKQTKLTSFRRQLNLYDFQRITHGRDAGSYYHELFLRGRPLLAKRMIRRKVKGTKIRASSSPDDEPNFYTMPYMGSLNDDLTTTPAARAMMEQDAMLGAGGGSRLSSLPGLQGPSGTPPAHDPNQLSDPSSAVPRSLNSLPSHLQHGSLYSDLMNSSAASRMGFPPYGRSMENLDYLALTHALQRNNFASSLAVSGNYPSFLHYDAALLDHMARLRASGADPRMSHLNDSLMAASSGLGAGANYPPMPGHLSSMLLNNRSPQRPSEEPSTSTEAARLFLSRMNQSNPNNVEQATSPNDEKQNAIEQLLRLQRDTSGAGAANNSKVEETPQESSKVADASSKEEHSAVLAL